MAAFEAFHSTTQHNNAIQASTFTSYTHMYTFIANDSEALFKFIDILLTSKVVSSQENAKGIESYVAQSSVAMLIVQAYMLSFK